MSTHCPHPPTTHIYELHTSYIQCPLTIILISVVLMTVQDSPQSKCIWPGGKAKIIWSVRKMLHAHMHVPRCLIHCVSICTLMLFGCDAVSLGCFLLFLYKAYMWLVCYAHVHVHSICMYMLPLPSNSLITSYRMGGANCEVPK